MRLQFPLLHVTVIFSVGDDDMVGKVEAHEGETLTDGFCDLVVVTRRTAIP